MPREASNTPKSLHGKSCGCQFCAMLRQGWLLISPGGDVFFEPEKKKQKAALGPPTDNSSAQAG